jgi:hypothetical protein
LWDIFLKDIMKKFSFPRSPLRLNYPTPSPKPNPPGGGGFKMAIILTDF